MGDPACFLDATCLSCGRFLDTSELDDEHCPHCGVDLPPRPTTTEGAAR